MLQDSFLECFSKTNIVHDILRLFAICNAKFHINSTLLFHSAKLERGALDIEKLLLLTNEHKHFEKPRNDKLY